MGIPLFSRSRFRAGRHRQFRALATAVATLLFTASIALGAPAVVTEVLADVKVSGKGAGAGGASFSDHEVNPYQVVGPVYHNLTKAEDRAGALNVQITALAESTASSSDTLHSLHLHMLLYSFGDPIFDQGHAEASSTLAKTITLDGDYRYSFSWTHLSFKDQFAVTAAVQDFSEFSGAGSNVYGADLKSQHQDTSRLSNIAHAGDEFSLICSAAIFSDNTGLPIIGYLFDDTMSFRLLPVPAGTSQNQALKPDPNNEGKWLFPNYPSGLWYDPPSASELVFHMTAPDDPFTAPDTLFNSILDFPTGLNAPVSISAEGQLLGTFGPGQSLDFVALLGHGVDTFTASGIDPPAVGGDSPGFALKLGFNMATADFEITAPAAVPEPAGILLAAGAISILATLRRRH
jgi:hypothetical protein